MSEQKRWNSYTSQNIPAELAKSADSNTSANQQPIATVEILIFGVGPGQSEVRISATEEGAFAGTRTSNVSTRSKSYTQLYNVGVREFGNAVQLLRS
jgi:hypothetical protein